MSASPCGLVSCICLSVRFGTFGPGSLSRTLWGWMRFLTAVLVALLFGNAVKLLGERPAEPTPQALSPVSGRENARPSGARYTRFDGRVLPYEIVDGMAVHGGDMILGTAEEAARWSIALERAGQSPPRDPLTARHASAVDESRLWPDRTIPYAIDANVPISVRQRITAAVNHWNASTPLTFTPRTSQKDFVRFQMTNLGPCRATLGKAGGDQAVLLLETCDLNSVIHEIGHAVGLRHEHQRVDRNQYIIHYPEHLGIDSAANYTPTAPSVGPYNYASVMHYSEFPGSAIAAEPIFESIPPGLLIGQRDLPERQQGLSAGDRDAVARLYGVPPTGITLATNPPGLVLVVDGAQVTTPRRYQWAPGSRHEIAAPLVQPASRPGIRYVFGRWSDGGNRSHRVTADPDTTWIEANFIVQQEVDPEVVVVGGLAPDSAIVGVRPPSADGYYTWRSPIELWAESVPGGRGASSLRFLRWFTGWQFKYGGQSSNPIRFLVTRELSSIRATFAPIPTLRVTTNVDLPIQAQVGGRESQLPRDVLVCTRNWTGCPAVAGGTIAVSAPEVQPDRSRRGVRYRFRQWGDSTARTQTYRVPSEVPAEGVELKLHVDREFELQTRTVGEGAVAITPASRDGYYAEGTRVTLRAAPAAGWNFATWHRDVGGSDPNHAFPMDRFRQVQAVFTQARRLWPGRPVPFDFDATNYTYFPYLGEDAFYVNVPLGATQLTVSAEISDRSVDLDLYMRQGLELGQNFEQVADYLDDGNGSLREVVITRQSDPPLRPGPYFIALVSRTPFRRIRGQVSARVEGHGPEPPAISVKPRALTFVAPAHADPQPQRIELVNAGQAELRFALGTDTAWVGAEPRQGAVRGGESIGIEIAPRSAGLQAGHYTGKLMVTAQGSPTGSASSGDAPDSDGVLAAVEVAFVKLPAD